MAAGARVTRLSWGSSGHDATCRRIADRTRLRLLRDTALRDEAYPLAVLNALRDPDTVAMVSTTWGLEIANVIARSEAKELVPAAQGGSFISLLEGLSMEVDADTLTHVLSDTLQLPLSSQFKLADPGQTLFWRLGMREESPARSGR